MFVEYGKNNYESYFNTPKNENPSDKMHKTTDIPKKLQMN